jgi:hypothetical protein
MLGQFLQINTKEKNKMTNEKNEQDAFSVKPESVYRTGWYGSSGQEWFYHVQTVQGGQEMRRVYGQEGLRVYTPEEFKEYKTKRQVAEDYLNWPGWGLQECVWEQLDQEANSIGKSCDLDARLKGYFKDVERSFQESGLALL